MVENPLFCSACGAGLIQDAAFCAQCGKAQSRSHFPPSPGENPLRRFLTWFKMLSIKGRIFYGYWIFINVSGGIKLLSINSGLASDNPACHEKLTMGNFLSGAVDNCSGYSNSSFGAALMSLVINNALLLAFRGLYKYFKKRRQIDKNEQSHDLQ